MRKKKEIKWIDENTRKRLQESCEDFASRFSWCAESGDAFVDFTKSDAKKFEWLLGKLEKFV